MTKAWSMAVALAVGMVLPVTAEPQKSEVEISVQEKKVVEPTLQGLSLVFLLNLRNASSTPLALVKYDYRVVVDETEYLNLQTELDAPIRLEPKGETLIALPIKITYEYLFQALPALKTKDQAACFVTGGMTFLDDRRREKRTPIAFSGEFPMFRGLEVKVLPIEARDLTFGGGDLVFKAAVVNPNGFAFKVDRLSYKLEIVGRRVSEGVTGQGLTVEARGENAFAIPLLLDFFDVGKSVYDGLTQPPVAVRLTGELELSSAYGSFRIAFDRSAKVPVQKAL